MMLSHFRSKTPLGVWSDVAPWWEQICMFVQHGRCPALAGHFAKTEQRLADWSQDAIHTNPLAPAVFTTNSVLESTVDGRAHQLLF